MKRFLPILLLIAGFAHAQTTYVSTATVSAFAYGQWSLAGQAANTYTFTPTTLCNVGSLGGMRFAAFSAFGANNAPVYINDTGTPANSEVVTPSAILACGVTISPANSHTTFSLNSATAGLQDAINSVATGTAAYPIVILLDRNWYTQAIAIPGTNPAAIIFNAKGSPTAYLEDVTTAPHTLYVWNGANYVAGTWTNAQPAVTVGAAAGTSPAISVPAASTASVGSVQLTSGTATATGTLWTLNWPTAGSFLYAPSCTVTSVGGTFTTFTSATTFASSHATLTVTATSAPAVSTVYLFSFSCK